MLFMVIHTNSITYFYMQKIDNESLIKNQNEEILKLQKQLVVKAELKRELLHKETLQQKLETLNAETEVIYMQFTSR